MTPSDSHQQPVLEDRQRPEPGRHVEIDVDREIDGAHGKALEHVAWPMMRAHSERRDLPR